MSRTQAVLLDAFGTLVELEPPWEHLAAEIGVDPERAKGAFLAEMSYYRDHAHEGRDAESLAELRDRCAAILSTELGQEVDTKTMMGAIRFVAYPDAAPALRELRDRGLRLVCVSNWDHGLPEVLAGVGLDELLDGVMTSARAGVPKPDPAIFTAALALVGCEAEGALHVGDSTDEDIAGARAAGIRALRIDRDGGGDIVSLTEVAAHL